MLLPCVEAIFARPKSSPLDVRAAWTGVYRSGHGFLLLTRRRAGTGEQAFPLGNRPLRLSDGHSLLQPPWAAVATGPIKELAHAVAKRQGAFLVGRPRRGAVFIVSKGLQLRSTHCVNERRCGKLQVLGEAVINRNAHSGSLSIQPGVASRNDKLPALNRVDLDGLTYKLALVRGDRSADGMCPT